MATASSQSYYNEVQSIFIELFDRPAATAGYNYFGSELATGANPVTVFGQISGSAEVTSSVTINSLFENLLGRAAGAPALAFFGGEMTAGQTIANIASQIYTDVLNESHTSQDYMVMTDKIAYANNYTGYLATNPSFTYNTANAQAYINQVTPAGVMTGTITSSSMPAVNAFVAGTTVNLVASSTSYIEPSSNGIVDFVDSSAKSLNNISNYILQAGAGNATLTVTDTAANDYSTFTLPTSMSGVSNINMTDLATAPSIVFSGASGVTSIDVSPVSTANFTGVAEFTIADTQTLTINADNLASSNVLEVVSTGTSVAIDLNNVGNNTATGDYAVITVNGPSSSSKTTSVTLSSLASSHNYVSISDGSSSAVSSITVKGAGATTLLSTANDTNLATLTADNTGALTFNIATNSDFASAFTFDGTAGSGQQTIDLGVAPTSGNTYAFDGGTNANNTVDVNYAATGTQLDTYLNTATNFQTLNFTALDTNVINLTQISSGFHDINLSVAASTSTAASLFTFIGASNTDNFNILNSGTSGSIVLGLNVSDAINNSIANVTVGSSSTTGLSYVGVSSYNSSLPAGYSNPQTLNITSEGVKGDTNTITLLTVADGAHVNITSGGSEALTITSLTDGNAGSGGVTFDAGSFAGALTLTDSTTTTNDTITLGSGTDNLTLSNTAAGGTDTVTLGSGSDVVTTAAGSDIINANTGSAALGTINADLTLYGTQTTIGTWATSPFDTISISNFGTNVTVDLDNTSTAAAVTSFTHYTTAITSTDTYAQAISAVVSAVETLSTPATNADHLVWFQYAETGGATNTYLVNVSVYDNAGTNNYTDSVVQLVGTASTLATTLGSATASATTSSIVIHG
jgi:hypothetical protein